MFGVAIDSRAPISNNHVPLHYMASAYSLGRPVTNVSTNQMPLSTLTYFRHFLFLGPQSTKFSKFRREEKGAYS